VRIVVAHNAYQHAGGEDMVAAAEVALLRANGHEVIEYRRHNDELASIGGLAAAAGTLWSRRTVADLRRLVQQHRPQVVHAHNTFPLLSPSLFWAAAEGGVPSVLTLHNFRLLCPQAMLLRDGRHCERCVGRLPWPGVVHGCYRGSRTQTAVLAGMLTLHRAIGTFTHKVGRYIALTEASRGRFVEGGLPADRIVVKPNFVDLPAPPEHARSGLLFVGRLAPEKGVALLAEAARALPVASLRVLGGGPESARLTGTPAVEMLGPRPFDRVVDEMQRAVALLLPSQCFENFPRTLVEAFACGLPVIASRFGALAELVRDGVTGWLVDPADPSAWATAMQRALAEPARMAEMGCAARAEYEARFGPAENHRRLMQIYAEAAAATMPAAALSKL